MNLSSADRCPRCGSPYMSSPKPGERPEDRYCYTCAIAAGDSKKQINLKPVQQPAVGDLELQPIEDELPPPPTTVLPRVSGRSSRASVGTGSRGSMPAAGGSRANIRAASSGSRVNIPAASGSRAGIRAASSTRTNLNPVDIPQLAPNPADYRRRSALPLMPLLGAGAALVLVIALYFVFRGHANPETDAANVTPEQPAPATAKATADAPKVEPTSELSNNKATAKSAPPIDVSKKTTAPVQVGETQQNGAVIKAKPVPKDKPAEIDDILSNKPRRKNHDDEDVAVAKTPVPAAATVEAAKPPDTEKKPDAPVELDADGKPKQPKAIVDVIGGIGEKHAKTDAEQKKENPFAPKVVAVTATEPTILPVELERISGNDKTMTEQLAAILPGWRVRDANKDNSKMGLKYPPVGPFARENTIALNPMNDVLPAKLIATVEIPKKFASQRPMLVFEVANPANGKEWYLSVKVLNTELLPKTRVKTTRDEPWMVIGVDLSALADKHFELEICAFSSNKKVTKEMLSYIRNVRIEWAGKKKVDAADGK